MLPSAIRQPLARNLIAFASLCGLLLPGVTHAAFYEKKATGWHWYDDPVFVEEIEPEEPKKEEEPPAVIVMEAPPAEKSAEVDGPPPLSAVWFRENLQVYAEKAIDNPTKENVEAYFLLQRIMMDKAQGFSDMARRVVTGDPILDESNRRSHDPASARMQETLSAKRRNEALVEVGKNAGIAFFFSKECDLCDNQASNLRHLSDRTGIEILPVSLDGSALPSGLFADSMEVDQGQAHELGIEQGPALFMLAPPDQWIPLAFGAVTQEDAITRILMGAVDAGILTEDELDRTKPINITPSLANALPQDGTLPEDPKELVEYLRNLEQR